MKKTKITLGIIGVSLCLLGVMSVSFTKFDVNDLTAVNVKALCDDASENQGTGRYVDNAMQKTVRTVTNRSGSCVVSVTVGDQKYGADVSYSRSGNYSVTTDWSCVSQPGQRCYHEGYSIDTFSGSKCTQTTSFDDMFGAHKYSNEKH